MMTVTPLCECSRERETVDHFLLQCNKYDKARIILMDSIKDIWISSKIKVTESLHMMTSHITKTAQKKINGALFEFLASVDRNLLYNICLNLQEWHIILSDVLPCYLQQSYTTEFSPVMLYTSLKLCAI